MTSEGPRHVPDSPFGSLLGLHIEHADRDEVRGFIELRAAHHQPMGIVHGGVYMSVIEELASLGADQHVDLTQRVAVGVGQRTDFLRASREGRLVGIARPVHIERDDHTWDVELRRDKDAELVARGQVRLKVVDLDVVGGRPPART